MEPIKINIEVGLKESTLTALKEIFGSTQATPAPTAAPTPKKVKTQEVLETKKEEIPAPAPAPVADDDDLPEAPAPKQATPSENEARQAVKAARDRGVSAKVIKEYMQSTFGIASSVECPADRRAELIEGLAKLAA
jgi:hypothetical protein